MFQIMSDYVMSLFRQRIFYKQCDLEREYSTDNINTLAISEEIMENGIRQFYAIIYNNFTNFIHSYVNQSIIMKYDLL